jgi:yecA family protein
MFSQDPPRALTSAERQRLERLLARGAGPVRSFEAFDGLVAALVSGPEVVSPGEILPGIMGHQLESLEQVQGTLALIMQHWNHVAATLLDGGMSGPSKLSA